MDKVTKNQWIIHFRWVNFIIHKICLNMLFKNIQTLTFFIFLNFYLQNAFSFQQPEKKWDQSFPLFSSDFSTPCLDHRFHIQLHSQHTPTAFDSFLFLKLTKIIHDLGSLVFVISLPPCLAPSHFSDLMSKLRKVSQII